MRDVKRKTPARTLGGSPKKRLRKRNTQPARAPSQPAPSPVAPVMRAASGERTYRANLFSRHQDVIAWAVEFSNADLEQLSAEEFRTRCDELMLINTYSRKILVEELEREVRELHGELRKMLADLASGDRAHGGTPHDLGALAHTARELAISFQWTRHDDQLSEELYPHDVRSGVLIRFRDAIMAARRRFRLRRCGACDRFFVPRRRQLACSGPCATKLRERRRDPEKRKQARRQTYATKKRLDAARARRRTRSS